MPTSAPAPWRNPGRDKAGFSGVGFFGQKYHPAIVPTAALGDDLAAALESSDWFNPKKILLTAEEREVLKETAGAMLGHFHDEKNKASDITQEAFERKRRAREYVEDYPAGATFPKMEEMTAKYLGDRNDRQISLEWRDGGFKVVIITLEDSPEAFQAKARRGAAYDQLVDYLFAFFEDCVNKK